MSRDGESPGRVKLPSRRGVAATIDRLEASLRQRGILVFARIDFSGDAARAGLHLRPQQMLIFGNPAAGTPLMLQVPAVGLDPISVSCVPPSGDETAAVRNVREPDEAVLPAASVEDAL